jgi:hypothetical protein
MVITESIGRTEVPLQLDTFLANDIYYPVIDKAISEHDRRFTGANADIMRGIGALIPGTDSFLDTIAIKPLAKH